MPDGVAFHYEDGELRIVSEVQAGWYRYVCEWWLRDDGVIKPRFGFAGTRNPRTCMRHQHHVYWRLDLDIDGAKGEVVEQRGRIVAGQPVWQPIVRETERRRGPNEAPDRPEHRRPGRRRLVRGALPARRARALGPPGAHRRAGPHPALASCAVHFAAPAARK